MSVKIKDKRHLRNIKKKKIEKPAPVYYFLFFFWGNKKIQAKKKSWIIETHIGKIWDVNMEHKKILMVIISVAIVVDFKIWFWLLWIVYSVEYSDAIVYSDDTFSQ